MTLHRRSQAPQTQMQLPSPTGMRALLGTLFCFAMLFSCIGFFSRLAVLNLFDFRHPSISSLASSLIWLALVGFVLWMAVYDFGIRQIFINLLAGISQNHFIALVGDNNLSDQIGFGFRIFNLTIYQIIIDSNGLQKVTWSKGQASSLAQRDMDDWHVAVWFLKDSIRRGRVRVYNNDSVALHFVGVDGPRDEVEPFGHEILNFLRKAGFEFEASECGTKFMVRMAPGGISAPA
jgi:hypothetical protein